MILAERSYLENFHVKLMPACGDLSQSQATEHMLHDEEGMATLCGTCSRSRSLSLCRPEQRSRSACNQRVIYLQSHFFIRGPHEFPSFDCRSTCSDLHLCFSAVGVCCQLRHTLRAEINKASWHII